MLQLFLFLFIVTPFITFILYLQYKFAKLSKLYFKLLDNKVSEKIYLIDIEFYSLVLKYGLVEFLKSEIPSNIVIDKKLQTKENEDVILRRKKVCEELSNLILVIVLFLIIGFILSLVVYQVNKASS